MFEPIAELKSLGISEQKAKETLKNQQLTTILLDIIAKARELNSDFLDSGNAPLLYQVGTRLKTQFQKYLPYLLKHVCNGNLRTEAQVSAALDFIAHRTVSGFSDEEFADACGIGVVVTTDEIEKVVEESIRKYRDQILAERYRFNSGKIIGEVRQLLRWANGKTVKSEIDLQILNLLGPKNVEDLAPVPKKSKGKDKKGAGDENPQKSQDTKVKQVKPPEEAPGEQPTEAVGILDLMRRLPFHKPGENYKTDGYITTPRTQELLQKHLQITGGKVMTRFPPEPNGVLHIGHAKAINIDFGYAQATNGHCYLRFDDTNPEKEDVEFVRAIEDVVRWLGYEPFKITHSSDYFDTLYHLAVRLIKSGDAYVCHQRAEDIKGFNPPPSPWRERAVPENLALFEDMKNGVFDEGEATLRMKTVMEEGKMDPVAYRIKYVAHHRTGDKWCIYPTYDYTHCIVDSLENITHSLCTKEFQNRRSSYYWLCNTLGIYCPVQWEYGRLSMSYTVTSKRKILKLIEAGIVDGWNDPRLYTLTALRRRGFPADAINSFVAKMGVSVAQGVVDPQMLEASVRDVLNVTAPRAMAVLDPLEVEVMDGPLPETVEVPDFPAEPERGKHTVKFGKKLWIDASDFRNGPADKSYKRLALNQPVGLKHANLVLSVKEIDNSTGKMRIQATVEPVATGNKPKGFIQWVADPVPIEVRLYERLFNHKNPEDTDEVPGGFLEDINEDSLKIVTGAMVDKSVEKAKTYDCFQFERVGFFSMDPDSKPGKVVFNRTVSLKEDSAKK